jgi:hypothetical protein
MHGWTLEVSANLCQLCPIAEPPRGHRVVGLIHPICYERGCSWISLVIFVRTAAKLSSIQGARLSFAIDVEEGEQRGGLR